MTNPNALSEAMQGNDNAKKNTPKTPADYQIEKYGYALTQENFNKILSASGVKNEMKDVIKNSQHHSERYGNKTFTWIDKINGVNIPSTDPFGTSFNKITMQDFLYLLLMNKDIVLNSLPTKLASEIRNPSFLKSPVSDNREVENNFETMPESKPEPAKSPLEISSIVDRIGKQVSDSPISEMPYARVQDLIERTGSTPERINKQVSEKEIVQSVFSKVTDDYVKERLAKDYPDYVQYSQKQAPKTEQSTKFDPKKMDETIRNLAGLPPAKEKPVKSPDLKANFEAWKEERKAPAFKLEQEDITSKEKNTRFMDAQGGLFGKKPTTHESYAKKDLKPALKLEGNETITSLVTAVKSALMSEGLDTRAREFVDKAFKEKDLASLKKMASEYVDMKESAQVPKPAADDKGREEKKMNELIMTAKLSDSESDLGSEFYRGLQVDESILQNLPKLEGSEKQIAFAESLRKDILKESFEYLNSDIENFNSQPERVKRDGSSNAGNVIKRKIYIKYISQIKSAKQIIEDIKGRNNGAMEFFRTIKRANEGYGRLYTNNENEDLIVDLFTPKGWENVDIAY